MKVKIKLPDGTIEEHDWTKKVLDEYMLIAGPVASGFGYKMRINP